MLYHVTRWISTLPFRIMGIAGLTIILCVYGLVVTVFQLCAALFGWMFACSWSKYVRWLKAGPIFIWWEIVLEADGWVKKFFLFKYNDYGDKQK